jgi:outer membrane protein assembly factor BamB
VLTGCASALDSDRRGTPTDSDWIWTDTTAVSVVTPAYDSARHRVYVASTDRELLALESSSGKVVWRNKYGTGYPIGNNIVVVGDLVFVGDVDMWVFQAATGKLVWILSRVDGNEGIRTIASDNSTVFVSGFDGTVQRLSQTSSTLWSAQLRRNDSTLNSFGNTLVASTLYVCGVNFAPPVQNGTLFALDAESGRERWRYEYDPELPGQSSKCYSRVASAGGLIFSTQDDGRIFAHDVVTGTVRWIIPRIHSPPSDPNGPRNGPYDDHRLLAANADHLIATSDDGTVICYSTQDGSEHWRKMPALGAALEPAVLMGGKALITHIGIAAAYDIATGERLWTRPSVDPHSLDPARYFTRPLVFGDTLVVGGTAGTRARLLSRN